MKSSRIIARVVGILFIIGTASGIFSAVNVWPMLEAPDLLLEISANQTIFLISSMSILTMGLSLAMVSVVIYPVLKKHNEVLAIGYVVFRGALETFVILVTVIAWMTLVLLSREYVQATGSEALLTRSLGQLAFHVYDQTGYLVKIIFPLGALMLNIVLYQSKLVPRWLAVWGLFGVSLHMIEGILTLFSILPENFETIMAIPIGIQEMVFAVWLIVKGFNISAISSGTAHKDNGEPIGLQLQ